MIGLVCVFVASPNRMKGTAVLTCELRYRIVFGVDTASCTPMNFGSGGGGGQTRIGSGIDGGIAGLSTGGRSFVEEIRDIEIFPNHCS